MNLFITYKFCGPDGFYCVRGFTLFCDLLLEPVYSDERKVDLPRGFLHAPFFGDRSPPANLISNVLFDVEQENKGNSQHLSSMFMTFGQFLDHDMSLTPQGHCTVQR